MDYLEFLMKLQKCQCGVLATNQSAALRPLFLQPDCYYLQGGKKILLSLVIPFL
jgi:hypothetical protein